MLAYVGLAPYLAWLMLRHRSSTLFTAANPGIAAGGAVGESKSATLAHLARKLRHVAAYCVLAADPDCGRRVRAGLRWMARARIAFPVVVKPDVGERGWGVALIHTPQDMHRYMDCVSDAIIVQRYVEGVEAGIFYCRHPDASDGRIVSIAQTHSTQAAFTGHSPRSMSFGFACHHATFTDARRWATPELALAIEQLALCVPGFYFGRFDVRAASVDALLRGEFKVIELNGVLAEPTHIYDPAIGLGDACATLCRLWRTAFEIGAANRADGAPPLPAGALIRLLAIKLWRVLAASRLRALARSCSQSTNAGAIAHPNQRRGFGAVTALPRRAPRC